MSIGQAKKSVENVHSWEEARDYAERRIKDLRFSLRIFQKMIADGVPWIESRDSVATQK
jgi:hypothetical protein